MTAQICWTEKVHIFRWSFLPCLTSLFIGCQTIVSNSLLLARWLFYNFISSSGPAQIVFEELEEFDLGEEPEDPSTVPARDTFKQLPPVPQAGGFDPTIPARDTFEPRRPFSFFRRAKT